MNNGIKVNAKISQIGNSLGVIIPSLACNSFDLEKGTPVIIEILSDKIIVRKEDKQSE